MTNKSFRTDDEIVDTYLGMIFKIAFLRTKNKSDAEDICQEVFLRYVKNKKQIDSKEHLKAWLIKVAINCSNSFWNSAWKRNTLPLLNDVSYINKEDSEIYHTLLQLSIKYRTVIHLFYYENLSIKEIALAMNSKPSTIRTWLTRARADLKKKLKGDYNDI